MLADLRYVKWVPSTHMQAMKIGVAGLLDNANGYLQQQLGRLLQPGAAQQAGTIVDSALDIFHGLETEWKEYSSIRAHLGGKEDTSAWLEPERRELLDQCGDRTGDFVYDFPADKLLKRFLLNNPQALQYSYKPPYS